MKKRIIIEVDSTEDKEKIEYYLKQFIKEHLNPFMADNFQKYKDAKITVEEVEEVETDGKQKQE